MEGIIYINGQIGSDSFQKGVELIDIIQQVKQQSEATSFRIHINSEGGIVDTGFDIFNYLKSLQLPLTTVGSGLVASIATVIFMAGDKRVLTKGTDFMIHSPWGSIDGTADEIEKYAQSVRDAENKLVKFYTNQTGLEVDAIAPLLKNETWLTEEQATSLGFATLLNEPILAKAYLNLNNDKQMTKDDKNWIEAKFEAIQNLFAKPIVNIVLQDANGVEIEFPEVMDGETPAVGAIANVAGQPAEGDYIMPDGSTYAFSDGILVEIAPAAAEQMEQELEALRQQLADKEIELQSNATLLAEKETQILNIAKEVKELKAGITSKVIVDSKKNPKEGEGAELSAAQKALTNLKQKRK